MAAFILALLSLLTALIPVVDREYQEHKAKVTVTVPPTPPEAGQPNVVFWQGQWWKNENGVWLVWRQNVVVANGGNNVLR